MFKNCFLFKRMYKFDSISPIDASYLDKQAYVYIIILSSSLILNTFILISCCCKKSLRGSKNYVMITYTCVNLLGSVLELPLMIVTHLKHRQVKLKRILNWRGCGCFWVETIMVQFGDSLYQRLKSPSRRPIWQNFL